MDYRWCSASYRQALDGLMSALRSARLRFSHRSTDSARRWSVPAAQPARNLTYIANITLPAVPAARYRHDQNSCT